MLIIGTACFSAPVVAADSTLNSLAGALNNLLFQLTPSVVTVEASISDYDRTAAGTTGQQYAALVSSGLVIDSGGLILVTAQSIYGKDNIVVYQSGRVRPATVVAVDYLTGLALLRTRGSIGQPVHLSGEYSCTGQPVIAIGNSYGLESSGAFGFCAGLRADGNIQFSAPVPSGSIGGGLFDLEGRLVGVITDGIGRGSSSAGLALPAQTLSAVVDQLLTRGDRLAGYVGITGAPTEIDPPLFVGTDFHLASASVKPGNYIDRGIIIAGVVPDSPASRAGLTVGDLLFSLNGHPISSVTDLVSRVQRTRPGTPVDLSLLRQSRQILARVIIGLKPITALPTVSGTTSSMPSTTDSLHAELSLLKLRIRRLEALLGAGR